MKLTRVILIAGAGAAASIVTRLIAERLWPKTTDEKDN